MDEHMNKWRMTFPLPDDTDDDIQSLRELHFEIEDLDRGLNPAVATIAAFNSNNTVYISNPDDDFYGCEYVSIHLPTLGLEGDIEGFAFDIHDQDVAYIETDRGSWKLSDIFGQPKLDQIH